MYKVLALVLVLLASALFCAPAAAQTTADGLVMAQTDAMIPGMNVVGFGLVIIGVGIGIGKIGASACEGIARQPEMAAKIQTAMIIGAALIEGAALVALILALMA